VSAEGVQGAVTLETLTRDHHEFLLALARKLCRDQADPADLVQDVLVRTVSHFEKLPDGVNHRAWMTQVMKNLFLDQLRRDKTRARFDPEALPPAADEPSPWWQDLDAGDIRAVLPDLPDELRDTFERFAFRGETYQQIADALAVPKQTVGTRILRARRRIKEILSSRRGAR